MTPDQKAKLKKEISKRWAAVVGLHIDSKEFAQLEYILQEAGLLARPRARRAKIEKLGGSNKAYSMNDTTEIVTTDQFTAALPQPELQVANGKPPADAKQLRTEAVGALLSGAYAGASTLKLKPNEIKDLTEPFPDDAIEIRPFDGIIYISHMLLRERLWKVFGPTEVAEICRERFIRSDSNEIAVDLVLMARGKFLAEGVGTAKYFPNNPKGSFGDTVESAWSEALRRCAKKIGLGTQVWRPQYVRDWLANNAVQQGGKWIRKDAAVTPGRKTREYTLKDDKPPSEFQKMKAAVQAVPETDEEGVPF